VKRLAEIQAPLAAAARFGLDVSAAAARPFGDGLIHRTWKVNAAQGSHLLQRLNPRVFADLVAVAENAAHAAARVDDALHRRGDVDPRHRLVYLSDPNGNPWTRDNDGAVWRAAVLIPDARPADPANQAEVRAAARLLGLFPELVTVGSGPEPKAILPGFHDIPARLANLRASARADCHGRLASCHPEVERLVELAPLADDLSFGGLPVRLVHNDAKLDNVLVDANTGEALCVVDLDTVMPGPAVHDFGDLVRSTVTGRPEDEIDLGRIVVSEATFHCLAAGYLEGAAGWITDAERSRLVDGVLAITYEQTLRFLGDYLAGDTYYTIDEPGHNLRRARAQLRLLEELLVSRFDLQRYIDLF